MTGIEGVDDTRPVFDREVAKAQAGTPKSTFPLIHDLAKPGTSTVEFAAKITAQHQVVEIGIIDFRLEGADLP